ATYLLIGDFARLHRLVERLSLKLSLERCPGMVGTSQNIPVLDPLASAPLPTDLAPGAGIAARAALAYLNAGAQGCLEGRLDALVTAPVNKEAIIRTGEAFVGQTEYLSQRAGTSRTAMMLLGEDDR